MYAYRIVVVEIKPNVAQHQTQPQASGLGRR